MIYILLQPSSAVLPLYSSCHRDRGGSSNIPGGWPQLLQEEEPQLVPQVQAQEQEGCAGALDGGDNRVLYNIYGLIIALFEVQDYFWGLFYIYID